MHKDAIIKRKSRAIIRKFLSALSLFCVTFGICWGIYYVQHIHTPPLLVPLVQHENAIASDSQIEQVEKFCQDKKLGCTSVKVTKPDTITIILGANTSIFLSTSKDLQKQLDSLQLTIQELTIEGKQLQTLDLRFERPVVTF